jgi:O-antigen/teichoic acid export membrane protein
MPHPIRNVFSNWGAFLFGALANFFLAPFIVHSLGNTTYGAWVLLSYMVGYLGLLDLGVRGAVMRFVAKLHAMGNHEEAGRFASAGLLVFIVSSVLAVLAGIGLAFLLERFFEIPPELIGEARIAVVLCAITIAFALLTGVFGGIVTAMQRFDLTSAAEMVIEALRIVSVVFVLRAGYGLIGLAIIQLVCGIIRFVVSYVMSRRLYPELELSVRRWTGTHMRQIFGFSVASTALHGAAVVILQLDAVVIGAFLPVSMVAFYAIAGTLAHYGRAVVDGITYTVPPRVSAQEGRGDLDGARSTALLGGKIASLVHLPIIVTFLLRGDTFIGLWMGPEYAELSGHVLWVLSLAYWFMAGRQIMVTTLMGLNRHKVLVPAAWTEAVLNVALSIWWVHSMGISGVAWGTTVPSLFFTTLLYPGLFGRALQIPVRTIWREIWTLPTLAVVPFAAASYVVETFWVPETLVLFFVQVAFVLPIFGAGAWWVAFSSAERSAWRVRLPAFPRSRLARQA